jgi:hypothetical protein
MKKSENIFKCISLGLSKSSKCENKAGVGIENTGKWGLVMRKTKRIRKMLLAMYNISLYGIVTINPPGTMNIS